jgi:hypothetical protein
MTDETLQGESPAEAAPPIPVADETPQVEANAEPATADETVEDAEPPKAKGVQKRIDELTRNWREAQRTNEQLLAVLQQSKQAPPPQAEPAKPAAPPTLEQFGYDESKYQTALLEFARSEAQAAAKAAIAESEKAREERTRADTFQKRQEEFAKGKPDYTEKVTDPTLPISDAMAQIIRESDDGPALAYYLAENRQLAAAIAKLPPIQAARELGKIEARLSQPEPAKAAPAVVSKAPPPPPKVDVADVGKIEKDPDELSVKDWLKWREKQVAKAQPRR